MNQEKSIWFLLDSFAAMHITCIERAVLHIDEWNYASLHIHELNWATINIGSKKLCGLLITALNSGATYSKHYITHSVYSVA